jgi:Arf-GAP with coiled-coil, ANK repeat and PH domain-containing protein
MKGKYIHVFIEISHSFYRGARTTIKDGGGLTALERRMELGAITDEELFILFVRYD